MIILFKVSKVIGLEKVQRGREASYIKQGFELSVIHFIQARANGGGANFDSQRQVTFGLCIITRKTYHPKRV